jgi:hypothetical protein
LGSNARDEQNRNELGNRPKRVSRGRLCRSICREFRVSSAPSPRRAPDSSLEADGGNLRGDETLGVVRKYLRKYPSNLIRIVPAEESE